MTVISVLTVIIIASLVASYNGFVLQRYNSALFLNSQHKNLKHHHNDEGRRRSMKPESAPISDNENELKTQMKKEGKIQALWNKYGPLYFQVWFSIYLPFLLTFFYVLDNNLLQSSSFTEGFDPKAAVSNLCNWLEEISGDPQLMSGIKENPRAVTFASGKKDVF